MKGDITVIQHLNKILANELVGGSDIMTEMAADGSLQSTIKAAVEAAAAAKTEA